ncbi:hypothetical protein [Tsukamurella soli]|uniref:hypothetical protein n=1 Tax=Tsukamurella soli TaxID=644556 RepID=UPI0031F04A7D
MLGIALIVGYVVGALGTARIVADHQYRFWSKKRMSMINDVVIPATFAAVFWPIVLPGIGVACVVRRARGFFIPTIVCEDRAKRDRLERRERADALRASAELLDDPDLRETLLDAANELDRNAW